MSSIFKQINAAARSFETNTGKKPDTVVLGKKEYKELCDSAQDVLRMPSDSTVEKVQGLIISRSPAVSFLSVCRDEQEKPRWVEPTSGYTFTHQWAIEPNKEIYFGTLSSDFSAEIARTNADRKIRAFIRANGGGGDTINGAWIPCARGANLWAEFSHWSAIGLITCATRELTEEVIRRFPAELRLLAGLEDK